MVSVVRMHAGTEITVSERVYRAHQAQAPHDHACPSVYLFLAGTCSERYGRRECMYGEASIVTNPAGITHAVRYGAEGGRILHLEFGGDVLQRVHGRTALLDDVTETRGGRAAGLLHHLYRELLGDELGASVMIEGLALEVAAAVVRNDRAPERREPAWLARVRELLHSGTTPRSLSEIAEAVGVHPTHLARTFRWHHGRSVGEYLRRVRIRAVCGQLDTSDLPLAEIALANGFADQSHLGRTFKRLLGVTPASYRRRMRSRGQPE